MARIYLTAGQAFGTVGNFDPDALVVGTNSNETVYVDEDAVVTFDSSFNRGGDTINIGGIASLYSAYRSGSDIIITNDDGAMISIPFGGVGTTINFADATRMLMFDGTDLLLGTQAIGTEASDVTAGSQGNGGGGSGSSEIALTAQQDILTGTAGNDLFFADVVQVDGRQVNSLGTGDRLEGLSGTDTLDAQITRASTLNGGIMEVQPRTNSIEILELEALNADLPNVGLGAEYMDDYDRILLEEIYPYERLQNNTEVYFDASNVRGHDEIWSYDSNANLTVTDLTTIRSNGGHDDARNTSDITIGMAYTRGQDTRWDASDFDVYFDNDFLLTGQTSNSQAFYFLLDQDADLVGGPLLDNINVDGIRFTVDGGPIIDLFDPAAQQADTHVGFIAALQDELDALIAAGVVPADTTLTIDPSITDFTFLDDGSRSSDIPAIVLSTSTDAVFTPVGFSQAEDAIGEYNVYGRFTNEAETVDLPLSVNIALEKVGSGGEGGHLIVGAMDKYEQGIDVFDVTVYGDDSRPSWLEFLDSTGGELDVINIDSDNEGFPTDSWASLFIGGTNDNMDLIDASGFFGDLTLGAYWWIEDLATLNATGGGDVTFYGYLEDGGAYLYQTGSGDDFIWIESNDDALQWATSSLLITTDGGDDYVIFEGDDWEGNELANHIILQNTDIETGDGDDIVETLYNGDHRIETGSGDDCVYSGQEGAGAIWVFNVDRAAYENDTDNLDELPGVPEEYSLIGGGQVRVTFSGPGTNSAGQGGAIMEYYGADGEASAFINGFEAVATIDPEDYTYYGTQVDINNAIIDAIRNDDQLSKLLTVRVGPNNTLIIESQIEGEFSVEDLDIEIIRPTFAGTTVPAGLRSEAIELGLVDSDVDTGLTDGDPDEPALYGVDLDNDFYSGIDNNDDDLDSFDNLWDGGSIGDYQTDSIHNLGAGMDLLVLDTVYDDETSTFPNGYDTLDGRYYDAQSNETVVITGAFGTNTVVNFQTAGDGDYLDFTDSSPDITPANGFDFLDFTAILTSMESSSGSSASRTFIPVTLEDDSLGTSFNPAPSVTIEANEVVIIDFDNDPDETDTFGGLSASVLQTLINGDSTDIYGSLDGSEINVDATYNNGTGSSDPDELVGGTGKAIVMVQTNDDLGVYKVFEVTWNGLDDATSNAASVSLLGTFDFGTSLEGIDEINLVGSEEYGVWSPSVPNDAFEDMSASAMATFG